MKPKKVNGVSINGSRNQADGPVLAAAVAVGADIIVTGDDDPLSLGHDRWTRMVTVRGFLDGFDEGP